MKEPWTRPQMHLWKVIDTEGDRNLEELSDEELVNLIHRTVCYRTSDGFVTREIAGEVLAVPVGEQTQKLNGMITFSEAGAFLWRQLEQPRTKDDLALLLACEYGMDIRDIEADVEEFISHALERGLILQCE